MNIEEIKLKNKVTPVCCMFFLSHIFISTQHGLENMEKLAC